MACSMASLCSNTEVICTLASLSWSRRILLRCALPCGPRTACQLGSDEHGVLVPSERYQHDALIIGTEDRSEFGNEISAGV